jgi:hypothetical protein
MSGKNEVNYVAALEALDSDSEDNSALQHLNSSMSKMALEQASDDNWEMPATALHPHRYVAGNYSFQISPVAAEGRIKDVKNKIAGAQKQREIRNKAQSAVRDGRKTREAEEFDKFQQAEIDEFQTEIDDLIGERAESYKKVQQAMEKSQTIEANKASKNLEKLDAAVALKRALEVLVDKTEIISKKYAIMAGLKQEKRPITPSQSPFYGSEAQMSRIHADARMSLSERIAEANAVADTQTVEAEAEPLHEEHAVEVDAHHVKAMSSAYAQRKPVRIDVRLGRLDSMSLFAKPSKTNANEYVVGTVVNDSTEAPVPMFTVNTRNALAKAIDTWAPTMAALNIDAATCAKVAKHAFTVAQRAAQ